MWLFAIVKSSLYRQQFELFYNNTELYLISVRLWTIWLDVFHTDLVVLVILSHPVLVFHANLLYLHSISYFQGVSKSSNQLAYFCVFLMYSYGRILPIISIFDGFPPLPVKLVEHMRQHLYCYCHLALHSVLCWQCVHTFSRAPIHSLSKFIIF